MKYNKVTKDGGFMRLNFYQPETNNCTLSYNTAFYGSDFSAYPVKMVLSIYYDDAIKEITTD